MSPLRFLTAPITALFDLKIYREVATLLKPGKALVYCAYLSFIYCVLVSVIGLTIIPKIDDFMHWLKGEWPGVTLTGEGLKVDEGRNPKALVHPQYGPIAMFDDTKTTITEQEMGSFFAYFTSTNLYTRSPNGGFQARPLPSMNAVEEGKQPRVEKLRFEGEAIEKAYFQFKPLVMTVFVFATFFFSWISRLIGALILSLIGYLVQLFVPRKLSFEKMFVIASFALSVGLWFSLLRMIPGAAHFFPGFLGQILTLVYFCIAIAIQDKPAAEA